MALKDLALTKNGDLYIGPDGDFRIIDSVRQALQIKLRWLKGEWVFNNAMGTPYLQEIFQKNPNLTLIEKILKEQILSVNGVHEIVSFELSTDTKSRILSCKFEVNSTEGEIEREVNLKIG